MSEYSKIIGGVFSYPEISETADLSNSCDFLSPQNLFMANARSALLNALNQNKILEVWIPSYICPSVIKTLLNYKYVVRFYPVDHNLNVASSSWISSVKKNSSILIVNYFGLAVEKSFKEELKGIEGFVIEDGSQALLNYPRYSDTDVTILSPRKFVGVPDGGILISKNSKQAGYHKMEPIPYLWIVESIEMMVQRRIFDITGISKKWYDLFKKTKKEIPVGNFSISDISRSLLNCAFDYSKISFQRIRNYSTLYKHLSDISLFGLPQKGQVPLGFPIRIKNRDKIRFALYEKNIFPPIHWEIKGYVPDNFDDSHCLSREILTIPCDQRYGDDDMIKIVKIIKKNL